MQSNEKNVLHPFRVDNISKIISKFTSNFAHRRDVVIETEKRVFVAFMAISLLGLSLAGCKDGPILVYSEVFDPYLVGQVASKCTIPAGEPREIVESFTPPAGGETWNYYVTPRCVGWGLRQ